MDTFKSWWLRKTVLKRSNWDVPQEENTPIQEENAPISEPLPPWAFPSWYELWTYHTLPPRAFPSWYGNAWSNLLTPELKSDPKEWPRAQIREPVSFLVAFPPLPD
jgi:hypothetical protein